MNCSRRDPIEPRRRLRHDDLLVKQLPEVAIGLKNSGPLAALNPFFELQNHAPQQRCEQQRREHLSDLQKDIANSHEPAPHMARGNSGAMK
jgi:hypothetical protein